MTKHNVNQKVMVHDIHWHFAFICKQSALTTHMSWHSLNWKLQARAYSKHVVTHNLPTISASTLYTDAMLHLYAGSMHACFDTYMSQHLIWSLAEPCINLRKFVPSSSPPLNSMACASWVDFDQTFECPVKITLSDK